MIYTMIYGGVWSIIFSLLLYKLLGKVGLSNIMNNYGYVFVVGPVEEISKLMALYFGYFIFRKELNEPLDGIIYISCVALGFSIIENIMYTIGSLSGVSYLMFRSLLCTPAHIIFSLFMGLAFYNVIAYKWGFRFLLLSLIFSSLAHGVYDLMLFNGVAIPFVILLLILAYKYGLIFLRYCSVISPFRETLYSIIYNYDNPEIEDGLTCLHCGSTHDKVTFKYRDFMIQKCDSCDYFITTKKSLDKIFQYFGAVFKSLKNMEKKSLENRFATLYGGNYFSTEQGLAFFDIDEFDNAIEDFVLGHIQTLEKQFWFFPWLIKYDVKK